MRSEQGSHTASAGPAPGTLRLRPAREDEAEALSGLALRSKGHWGYDAAFLAACRDELRLKPGEMAAHRTAVAEECAPPPGAEEPGAYGAYNTRGAAGGVPVRPRILGFATLEGVAPAGELGMLFVEPAAIGRGVGRLLYRHVLAEAGRLGFTRVVIASDPHAESFYLAMGAERTGTVPSGSISGRTLPLLTARTRPGPRRPGPS